jgi:hypothetical protein
LFKDISRPVQELRPFGSILGTPMPATLRHRGRNTATVLQGPLTEEKVMKVRIAFVVALTAAAVVAVAGCGHLMMMHGRDAVRPEQSEFGFGPRTSDARQFTATLQPTQPLQPRRMHTMRVVITDAAGSPVDNAAIRIDGGMPEHGHGLPTRPRVTRALGNGLYEIEGVRFNMGGWWELTLAITAPAGSDVVTFNLAL